MNENKKKPGLFFAAILILVLLFLGFFIYKKFSENKFEEVKYTAKVYKDAKGELRSLNDRFIIEEYSNHVKIMDMKTNVLFDDSILATYIYEGVDGEIYAEIANFKNDRSDNISYYRLKNHEFKLVKSIDSDEFPTPVISTSNGKEHLLGYQCTNGIKGSKFYDLNGEERSVSAFFKGDGLRSDVTEAIFTFSDDYMIVSNHSGKNYKYGLYSFSKNKIVVGTIYDGLYPDANGNLVAVLNNKAGVISKNGSKIVDFKYDFIDRNDYFFLVSKDNKMAIMNLDYKVITDYFIPYLSSTYPDGRRMDYFYEPCCGNYNTFYTEGLKDHFIVVTFDPKDTLEKPILTIYFIDKEGKHRSFKAIDFSHDNELIYSYSKKHLMNVYDENLNEKFTIDLKEIGDSNLSVRLINQSTLVVTGEDTMYFSYKTGKRVDKLAPFKYDMDGITIKFSDNKLTYLANNKELGSIKDDENINIRDFPLTKLSKNAYFNINAKNYIYIEKE